MGARLKEERLRLEKTQRQLADIGGQAVNSQSLYERGERAPTGAYLAEIAAAGADVLYIVTGKHADSGAGISPGQALETITSAESELESTGALNGDIADKVIAIACDDTLDDPIRARADLVIRFAMRDTDADKAAELRQAERRKRVQAEMDWSKAVVADAIQAAGWTPSPQVVGHLVNLVRLYKVEGDVIMLLLHDLAALVPDQA
ncbi:hypothetical protein AWH62_00800 [Maricaulis sp. W15]|nr:hypothetical protein AWH62_00800 [Maricaulis sp. W15]